jgi:RHS repeat-associated protein
VAVVEGHAAAAMQQRGLKDAGGELQFLNNDSNHYKFTGKERDSETGLDYFGARYYSNGLGRFITPDWGATPAPVSYADLGDPQSLNQYSYVRNIPTVKVDADGHGTCPPVCTLPDPTPADWELIDEAGAGATGISLSAVLTGAAIVFGPAMLFPDALPGGKVGQSNADERAQIEQASQERAQQNGGVDSQLGHASGAGEEKSQSDDAKDRARTNGGLVKGEDFSPSAKKEIDARDGNKCRNCGRDVRSVQNKKGQPTPPDQRHRHHMTPKSEGGKGTAGNGKTLYPACHKEEHRRMREAKKNEETN